MKLRSLILSAVLAMPLLASAGDPVKFEVFLDGKLAQKISLAGPNAHYKFSPEGHADTTVEFKLIAPEPLILEMKEVIAGGTTTDVIGRVSLTQPGSKMSASDIKGAKFHNQYVLVRAE